MRKPVTVYFGHYSQHKGRMETPVEWLVLTEEDTRILVISKYALSCQPYNTTNAEVTWETCTLRKWLNETFLNDAFSKEEQDLISTVAIGAEMEHGNDTLDRIFLLSTPEVNNYFSTDTDRQCKPTEITIELGRAADNDTGNCRWWLRSSGYKSTHAAYVSPIGFVYPPGWIVNSSAGAVRPALWINKKVLDFQA